MKIVIVEDELPALEKLERYILKYDSKYTIVARLSGIADTVAWIQKHRDSFDLLFLDIQLSDGLSFEIFNQVTIQKPVIFVTAFDEYAIDAFKVNSIDYILKPITFSAIATALNKLKRLKTHLPSQAVERVSRAFSEARIKDRFLVRLGSHIHSIKVADIALFYAEGRTVFLMTFEGKKFILDYTLEDLVGRLDRNVFYRANRTYIVNLNAIENVVIYSNSRLKVVVDLRVEKEIIVSRDRVAAFKEWFAGGVE